MCCDDRLNRQANLGRSAKRSDRRQSGGSFDAEVLLQQQIRGEKSKEAANNKGCDADPP